MSHSQLAIQMHRDLETGQWFVERIDAVVGIVSTKTAFRSPIPLEMVFISSFIDFLTPYLPARAELSVTSVEKHILPDSAVQLGKVRFVAQRAMAGLQTLTIRIQDFAGQLTALYAPVLQERAGSLLGSSTPPNHTQLPLA